MSIRELQSKAVANSLGLATLSDIPASGVTSLDGLTGAVTLSSPDASITINTSGNDIEIQAVPVGVTGLDGLTGSVTLSSPDSSITINTSGNDIEIQAVPVGVYQATYYKSVQQNLVNADTDITFDSTGAWNNPNGYITHVNGTKDFTVVQAGLYQLEFNISVNANGATWNTGVNKVVSIDITRPNLGEHAVIQNSSSVANSLSYQQSVVTSYYLMAGDVINLRSTLAFATATPFVIGVLNTFDLNTFFNWRFIS